MFVSQKWSLEKRWAFTGAFQSISLFAEANLIISRSEKAPRDRDKTYLLYTWSFCRILKSHFPFRDHRFIKVTAMAALLRAIWPGLIIILPLLCKKFNLSRHSRSLYLRTKCKHESIWMGVLALLLCCLRLRQDCWDVVVRLDAWWVRCVRVFGPFDWPIIKFHFLSILGL